MPAGRAVQKRLYIATKRLYIARSRRTPCPSALLTPVWVNNHWGLRELHTYHSPLDLVRERSPERPVAIARPDAAAVAARWFQKNFNGRVLYAVKANPSPWVIETLAANGVTSFDVASIPEIELVAPYAPGSAMAFMHPVKSRKAIAQKILQVAAIAPAPATTELVSRPLA